MVFHCSLVWHGKCVKQGQNLQELSMILKIARKKLYFSTLKSGWCVEGCCVSMCLSVCLSPRGRQLPLPHAKGN